MKFIIFTVATLWIVCLVKADSTQHCVDPNVRYLVHSNCSRFIQCGDGIPYVMDCPEHTIWNQNCNYCDWPSAKDSCTPLSTECKEDMHPSKPVKPDDGSTNPVAPNEPTNPVQPEEPTKPDVPSEPVDPTKPVLSTDPAAIARCKETDEQYFEHATDCHKFIQCSNHRAYEMNCPNTLVWNKGALVCDWEAVVGSCVPKTPVLFTGSAPGVIIS